MTLTEDVPMTVDAAASTGHKGNNATITGALMKQGAAIWVSAKVPVHLRFVYSLTTPVVL